MQLPKLIPTGSKNLDKLFMYQPGVLHCFYGPTGSGKTTLSAYIPIVQVTKWLVQRNQLTDKVVFAVIDTDGGYDWERLEIISEANGVKYEVLEKHIIYKNPQDFAEQHKMMTKQLDKDLENKIPLVIALDPAVAIYQGIILRAPRKVKAVMIGEYIGKIDEQLQVLRYYAVNKKSITTVSTWPVSEVGEAISGVPPDQPFIGGSRMGFLPKMIIGIDYYWDASGAKAEKHPTIRLASLWKHRSKPAGLKTVFKLCDKGVCDVEEKELPPGGSKDKAIEIVKGRKK
ncbi:hypothetical protein DRP04_05025 [Archaeoglobales archaeon]|nr:MAG: hypothetical protein DRP04_05025 [Archaeoglobales archaeon]